MNEKLRALWERWRETVMYLIFGVVTTVVNFVIYYALLALHMHYIAAQVIAWVGAVLVAYVTNRRWVFDSRVSGARAILGEMCAFVASRLFSFFVETALLWLMVDVLLLSEKISKIPVAVLTVVLNYITGKLIVFRKKK